MLHEDFIDKQVWTHLGAATAAGERRAGPSGQIRQGQRGVARLGPRVQEGGPNDEEKEKKDLRQHRRGGLQVAGGYHDAPDQRQRPYVHGAVFHIPGDEDDHMGH